MAVLTKVEVLNDEETAPATVQEIWDFPGSRFVALGFGSDFLQLIKMAEQVIIMMMNDLILLVDFIMCIILFFN